jgi:hypothetical protein
MGVARRAAAPHGWPQRNGFFRLQLFPWRMHCELAVHADHSI